MSMNVSYFVLFKDWKIKDLKTSSLSFFKRLQKYNFFLISQAF